MSKIDREAELSRFLPTVQHWLATGGEPRASEVARYCGCSRTTARRLLRAALRKARGR